jgi:hypothetical protein
MRYWHLARPRKKKPYKAPAIVASYPIKNLAALMIGFRCGDVSVLRDLFFRRRTP